MANDLVWWFVVQTTKIFTSGLRYRGCLLDWKLQGYFLIVGISRHESDLVGFTSSIRPWLGNNISLALNLFNLYKIVISHFFKRNVTIYETEWQGEAVSTPIPHKDFEYWGILPCHYLVVKAHH